MKNWRGKKVDDNLGLFAQELLPHLRNDSEKTDFTVRNVNISPKELSDLSAVIRTSKTLRDLTLSGTRLNNSTQLVDFFEALKANSSIRSIDLSENGLCDDGAALLAEVVQIKHNITSLKLSNCGISFEGCEKLRKMLEINKKITVLDVSGNSQIGEAGVQLLCQGILDKPLGEESQIVDLNFSGVSMGDEACKILGSVVASCRNLSSLQLRDNQIRKAGAKFLSHGLMKKGSAMNVLDLSENLIGDEGVNQLAKRLSSNGGVKNLNLSKVGMKTESFKNLCKAVANSDFVQGLNVGSNPVDQNCVANIAIELLTNSASLVSLDLSKLPFSLEDVKVLGDFIGQPISCRLQELYLAGTGITDEGAVYLANGLRTNMELRVLDVTSNPFGAKGARAFAKTFRRSKNLTLFKVTGYSRIGSEGENYLAECLKWNRNLVIKGASKELDYLDDFINHGQAFTYDNNDLITGWSEEAWEVVKRGCGQIIATVISLMSKEDFKHFKNNVVIEARNVVEQNMFEYVIRHAEAPALEAVNVFVNKCGMALDHVCLSYSSMAMAKGLRKVQDVTYRAVGKDYAKDPIVKEMCKNNRLFLGRYLTINGPAIHQTHEVIRLIGNDTQAVGKDKDKPVFVQIFENEMDFLRETKAREDLKRQLAAAGPFAIYDTLLREVEVHDDHACVSYMANITDLRHSINNLGVTAGYDLHETVFLAKRAAQCLGTVNNLGRIHGDFRPRNFLKVANKRLGTDPVGRTNKKVMLPDKWVVFDLSKSVAHGDPVELRLDSSYLPPEVARVTFNANYTEKQLPTASEKMDVWCFGVVLYQLLTGIHLFHCETNTDRMFKASERLELMNWINLDEKRQKLILHRANESRFINKTTFERIKKSAIDLVNWCLQGDPFNRPSFNEVLSHPFFVYKTNVNYTDLDLLLGWYQKIGADITKASHKNNRTHAHVANAVSKEAADVFTVLKLLYSEVGCTITNDAEDWKLDIEMRREKVQKARSLIVLLEEGVFWRPEIMQKLIWAMDSVETQNLILVDISTAFTNAKKFDFDAYKAELNSEEGQKKLQDLVKSLFPVESKLGLQQIKFEKSTKWLMKYIKEEVNEYIMLLQDKVIPYRTRDFQTRAMVNEMLRRSGFISSPQLKAFNLFDNVKSLFDAPAAAEEKKSDAQTVKILLLFNDATEKLQADALGLRKELMKLESSKVKPEINLISNPQDVYKHFEMSAEKVYAKDGKVSSTRILQAETQTLVLCLVSPGFYDLFREQVVLLNSARGVVTVLPLNYNYYDVTKPAPKEEILNLGLENKDVLARLQDNKSYIPLPKLEKNLQYESDAALSFILKESGKLLELSKGNEAKGEDNVYTRYTKSNFFETVY